MFNSNETYINLDQVNSESLEGSNYSVRKFIAAGLLSFFVGIFALQTGFILNANAEGSPISSPATSEEIAGSPSPSSSPSSSAPVTAPEVSPTPSATASASPSAPVTYPEVSPSATASATPSAPVTSAYLKLHFPNGGEIFNVGDFVRVGWEQDGLDNYNCLLSYVNDSGVYGTHMFLINPLQLYFNWIVDISNLAWGESTRVKIGIVCSDPLHNGVFDFSDDFFTVNRPIPSVTPTPAPSEEPIATPSATPTPEPSDSPEPSATASATPTPAASTAPSNNSDNGGNNGGGGAPSCNNEAPKAPKLISAFSNSNNEVVLNWEKASGNVTHYLITYGFEAGKPLFGNPNVGNVTSYTVKGLSGEKNYYFKVKAVNGCMPGESSNELTIQPKGEVLNTPAVDFQPGVLGKTTESTMSAKENPVASATPAPSASSSNTNPSDAGLLGKIWNFLKNLFN